MLEMDVVRLLGVGVFVFVFLHDIGVFGKAIVYISRLLVTSTP